MKTELNVGDNVIACRAAWLGSGTVEDPCRKGDIDGIITSIKGITPGHTNIHMYEVTTEKLIFYTDGKPFYSNDTIGILIKK
jgi:hypothetical protein